MEHYVTDIDTLIENETMQVEVMYRMILLVYSAGEVYAVEDRCPHMGISLSKSKVDSDCIRCKDHGLAISLKSGEVINENQANYLRLDKSSRSIKTYQVSVKEGKVFIVL